MRITIQLTEDAANLLRREINGTGGWQSLLATLQNQLQGNELTLTVDDIARVLRYTTDYGYGGFEDRMRPVLAEVRTLVNGILDALRMN